MQSRSRPQLEANYEVERELARRLMVAPPGDRPELYGEVYDELFHRVPDLPLLTIDPAQRKQAVAGRVRFVSRFVGPGSSLMEIGAGDCEFAVRIAPFVRRVIAIEVSDEIATSDRNCENLEVVLSKGITFPIPDCSIDLVFSDNLLEHLHPDDALVQLRDVRRMLRAGGKYVCITPNRLSGPHDISRMFDDVASGLHLREYSARELGQAFSMAGFHRVDFYSGGRGFYLRVPSPIVFLFERLVERIPARLRRRVSGRSRLFIDAAFGVTAVATA